MERILSLIGEILVEKYGASQQIEEPLPTPTLLEKTVTLLGQIPVPGWLSTRTTMEKSMIAGGACYMLWQAHRNGLFTKASRHIPKVVPGTAMFKRRFGKPTFVAEKSERVNLESRVEGSYENKMTPPGFQCKIGYWNGAEFNVIGSAIRLSVNGNDYLVAPDHVIGGDDSVEMYAYGKKGYVSISGTERIILDTDLAAIKMTNQQFSQIGMTVASIKTLPTSGSFVNIVGPMAMGTAAELKHDATIFGRVVYMGTTERGYSGSSYLVSGGSVGLHQAGGRVNSGYNIEYVHGLLCVVEKSYGESSKKWLEGQYQAGKKIKWQVTGDPDRIQVRINGKYTVVHRESMDEAFGTSWVDEEEIYVKSGSGYRDYESLPVVINSGEAKPVVANPGVSTGSVIQGGHEEPNPQLLIRGYSKLSKEQKLAFRKSLGLLTGPEIITAGQERQVKSTK